MFGLTTLVQQPGAQGAQAVELLLSQLDHAEAAPPDQHLLLPTALTVRASTAAHAAR
jgi:DNA-binding LacI/PurR family transcriptional regulator